MQFHNLGSRLGHDTFGLLDSDFVPGAYLVLYLWSEDSLMESIQSNWVILSMAYIYVESKHRPRN